MGLQGEIGIFGGSFNPVHCGHIAVAEYVAANCALDCVLMMLSPVNPFKVGDKTLAGDADRLAMLRLACEGHPKLRPCDRELAMPRPSYTIDTLTTLAAENPGARFRVIIGGDNWDAFGRWRESERILREFGVIVYPRPGQRLSVPQSHNVTAVPDGAPLLDVSSTHVRQLLNKGGDISQMVDPQVMQYIKSHHIYGKSDN